MLPMWQTVYRKPSINTLHCIFPRLVKINLGEFRSSFPLKQNGLPYQPFPKPLVETPWLIIFLQLTKNEYQNQTHWQIRQIKDTDGHC